MFVLGDNRSTRVFLRAAYVVSLISAGNVNALNFFKASGPRLTVRRVRISSAFLVVLSVASSGSLSACVNMKTEAASSNVLIHSVTQLVSEVIRRIGTILVAICSEFVETR